MDFWEFLPFGPYTAPTVSEMQQGEIELSMAWKKKILFFIYFDIISLTKTFRKYKLIIQMLQKILFVSPMVTQIGWTNHLLCKLENKTDNR